MKAILNKVIHRQPTLWHRYLPGVIFACREVPYESTGFSPFELLFGRRARGPMDMLASSWSSPLEDNEDKTLYQYVFDLKNFLADACELVAQNLGLLNRNVKSTMTGKLLTERLK
eukprot:TRINITY_DN45891_c0_g1_i3.p1 TRINITY_DN45891_c0_g1~~TRINITY_DN45891_c0_g1_i3.p1  ORF type:complete len:115 (+),score=17.67 TRINITY_DN45891_c0_g1_i3:495-839(+)